MSARDSLPAGSLSSQIDIVEQRLLRRRQASAAHTATLKRHVLARLVSPLAFLVAAGAGFTLERWYRRCGVAGQTAPADSDGSIGAISLTTLLPFITLGASMIEWAQVTFARQEHNE
jgi:hypothetical protein